MSQIGHPHNTHERSGTHRDWGVPNVPAIYGCRSDSHSYTRDTPALWRRPPLTAAAPPRRGTAQRPAIISRAQAGDRLCVH
eukprot:4381222-Prymnesium_polylepis.2